MILLVGDIHAEYRIFFERVAKLDPQPTAIFQVGDLGGVGKSYPDFPIPTYFIQGNHENWDLLYGKDGSVPLYKNNMPDECCVAEQENTPENLYQITNGSIVLIDGLLILGLGGNYSSKFYPIPRRKIQGDRRRHFTEEEVLSCDHNSIKTIYEMNYLLMQDLSTALDEDKDENPPFHGVDVMLTHEAPSPYVHRGKNCGVGQINGAIRNAQPKLHFFGHHHYDGEYEYEGVKSYGLGMGFKTGMLLDPKTLEVERVSLV